MGNMKNWLNAGITCLVFTGMFLVCCQEHREAFASEKWKSGGGINITLDTRANMVGDLLESEILIGKMPKQLLNSLEILQRFRMQKVAGSTTRCRRNTD